MLETLMEIDPKNNSAALDLSEVYLLLGLREEHKVHSSKHSSAIKAKPYLSWYLQAVILYQDSEEVALREHIRSLIESLGSEKKEYMIWRFDEFISTIESDETTPSKQLLLRALRVLRGDLAPSRVEVKSEKT